MFEQQRVLCDWEVEELVEAICRRTHWYGNGKLWVRRSKEGQNQLALKIVNGLPDQMCRLYVKSLNEDQIAGLTAERYVEWLLIKFTSYGWRQSVEQTLRSELGPEKAFELARKICQPTPTVPPDGAVQFSPSDAGPTPQVLPAAVEMQKPLEPKVSPAARSKFLRNLLK